eukprot:scaffold1954_cov268-Pinguiococcus_pyrenoidosus.AAC.77
MNETLPGHVDPYRISCLRLLGRFAPPIRRVWSFCRRGATSALVLRGLDQARRVEILSVACAARLELSIQRVRADL